MKYLITPTYRAVYGVDPIEVEADCIADEYSGYPTGFVVFIEQTTVPYTGTRWIKKHWWSNGHWEPYETTTTRDRVVCMFNKKNVRDIRVIEGEE
jgi:hypothetical protein